MKKDLERCRSEIGTDYIDVVLLHAITDGNWNKNMKGAMEAMSEAKEEGIIRAHGISCHSLAALETAADEPWVELDLARFNPGSAVMDADVNTVQKVLERMKKNGKSVMGMKVYGAGRLVGKKDECLQFQLGTKITDSFTMGLESIEHLRDLQKRLPEASVRG
jgi:predicted aldo/keto reductase-like oxidoreductase